MDPRVPLQHRLVDVWSWLPAFRAVAEVEHVQRAARSLHVTASSLSRAIRLLEEQLGRRVFDRVGRNVRLNKDGEILLAAVRDGMRRIDDGLAAVTETSFAGELRVACQGDHPIALTWRAAARLVARYPALRTTVEDAAGPDALASRLLRGDLDVAIVEGAPDEARLLVERLGEVTYGIYCGVGHPLYARKAPTIDAIRAHAFVAPTSVGDGGSGDQWPREWERTVALRLPALAPAIAVCASGALLAVLPDRAVLVAEEATRLRRLPSTGVRSSSLFVVRRRPTGGADRAGAFVEELRAEVSDPGARPRRRAPATAPRARQPSPGGRSRRGAP